jgi:branched-chain amino acid transport system substrate-binding protein
VLGTIIRETIGAIGTARKLGYNPTFLGSSAAYTDLIHKLGGPAMNGLYATDDRRRTRTWTRPRSPVRFWATKYQTKFNEEPTVFSVYGYFIDRHLRQAVAAQGRSTGLNTDSFIKVMDTLTLEPE